MSFDIVMGKRYIAISYLMLLFLAACGENGDKSVSPNDEPVSEGNSSSLEKLSSSSVILSASKESSSSLAKSSSSGIQNNSSSSEKAKSSSSVKPLSSSWSEAIGSSSSSAKSSSSVSSSSSVKFSSSSVRKNSSSSEKTKSSSSDTQSGVKQSSSSEKDKSSSSSAEMRSSSSEKTGKSSSSSKDIELSSSSELEDVSSSSGKSESSSSVKDLLSSSSEKKKSSSSVTPLSSSSSTSVSSSSSVEEPPTSSETESSSSSSEDKVNCSALLEGETDWSWDVPKECRFNPDIDYGTMTDERDGKVYKTVKIGDQTWMAENLNYADSVKTPSLKGKNWCYNKEPKNCEVAGRLYSWAAAIDSVKLANDADNPRDCGYGKICGLTGTVKGICPTGWHLPSQAKWSTLITAVGGQLTASKVLKSQSGWNGTDAFGFAALPAGQRGNGSSFYNGDNSAYFWSSTEYAGGSAYGMILYNTNEYYELQKNYNKGYGFSVRCVKD